ncbi:PREDICTED: uncharacterized protein LOC108369768 isoform X3 [Rhagoletis zephyria]|nr:PREDICTED: uncharacterized protein LOC108369768 isoform X3 [Rhagoletis zephyria]
MYTIAFHLVAEEMDEDVEQNVTQRRHLRDATNPLELPQALFQKYHRVNKAAFRYLLDVLTAHTLPAKKPFAISPLIKLDATLRFFAERIRRFSCSMQPQQSERRKKNAKFHWHFTESMTFQVIWDA